MIISNDKPSVIRVRELSKKFGQFTAVDKVSFDVRKGDIFGFLGPNGSGKTTTIRMMLGLIEPSTGDIEILGHRNGEDSRGLRSRLGYMSQRFSLYNDLTVIQNLNFYGAAYGIPQTDLANRIDETLLLAGLSGKGKIKTSALSGGWRQRLALGVAILHRPEIVFLDEPTAGVDPVSRRTFWNLLYDLVNADVTVFVTTHYMDEAEHCHQLAFIMDGKLVVSGTPSEIKRDNFRGKVIEVFVADQAEALKLLQDEFSKRGDKRSQVELYGSSLHVFSGLPGVERIVKDTLAVKGIKIIQMQVIAPSLEDVFISATMKK